MLPLDIGSLYMKLLDESKIRKHLTLGCISLMAISSHYNIGALNAESFCERIILAGNLIMNGGNSLINDKELEMLVILLINHEIVVLTRNIVPASEERISKVMFFTEEENSAFDDWELFLIIFI